MSDARRGADIRQKRAEKLNEQHPPVMPSPSPSPSSSPSSSPSPSYSANGEKIAGDYQWKNTTLQSQYSNALWHTITTHKFAGFSPEIPLTEKNTGVCVPVLNGNFLRKEGGLCYIGYWFEDANGTKIDSKEKLVLRFAPIENEAEAMSFVVATIGNLTIDTSGIPEGHTSTIDDGFLVQLVFTNRYDCGRYTPIGVIFKVSQNGEVQHMASETRKLIISPEIVPCID